MSELSDLDDDIDLQIPKDLIACKRGFAAMCRNSRNAHLDRLPEELRREKRAEERRQVSITLPKLKYLEGQ